MVLADSEALHASMCRTLDQMAISVVSSDLYGLSNDQLLHSLCSLVCPFHWRRNCAWVESLLKHWQDWILESCPDCKAAQSWDAPTNAHLHVFEEGTRCMVAPRWASNYTRLCSPDLSCLWTVYLHCLEILQLTKWAHYAEPLKTRSKIRERFDGIQILRCPSCQDT
jgi:hypothetical protein